MVKVGTGGGNVIVKMTPQEFRMVSGSRHGDIADGDTVSLVSLRNTIDLIDDNKPELIELKALASSVVEKLDAIGI